MRKDWPVNKHPLGDGRPARFGAVGLDTEGRKTGSKNQSARTRRPCGRLAS